MVGPKQKPWEVEDSLSQSRDIDIFYNAPETSPRAEKVQNYLQLKISII